MVKGIFVTGTDTGVGKTVVTGLLGRFLAERGVNVVTQKWVQTGCKGVSEDIEAHIRFMDGDKGFFDKYTEEMAPYIFEFPSSPHLAAALEEKSIDTGRIESAFRRLAQDFDYVIAEGAGGALVPVSEKELMIDIAEKLALPVLVVARNRLGAINQTLLTVEALKRRGLKIAGIVFNHLGGGSNEVVLKDNLQIITKLSGVKVLGELPFREDAAGLYEDFIPIGERILA